MDYPLTTTFQEVAIQEQLTDSARLLSQNVTRAGFYHSGTIASSVTKAITIELEKACVIRLGEQIEASLSRTAYERWAWEACINISGQFLQSPPDHFVYMEDPIFQVAIAVGHGSWDSQHNGTHGNRDSQSTYPVDIS